MSVYQGNFTTYFSTWLNDNATEIDGVVVYPHKVLVEKLFEKMPSYTFNENNEVVTFADRFIKRNYYKEIGSETYELFEMHLANGSYEVATLFGDKIRTQLDNFNKLYERFIEVEESDTYDETSSDKRELKDYYNPVVNTFTESNANIDTASSDDNTYTKEFTETRKRAKLYSFLKTNPQLMDEVNKVEIMYERALEYLDILFMVVL